MAYNINCMADFGKSQTGLTVHGKLQNMSGTLVGSIITSGIVESSVAPGQYLYTLSVSDGFSGFFVMYNSADDNLRRTVGISPLETEGVINTLGMQAKADVNAEVVDALTIDTYEEPTSVPAAASSLMEKIRWLFALSRNKITQDATTQTLRNDADSGNIAESAVSDNGTTMTRGEWS